MKNLNRRGFIRQAVVGAGALISSAAQSSRARTKTSPAGKQPNILFINTDDQAQWGVGAYGNTEIHTPYMNRLAAEGIKFTRAFTCPVCSPSRAMVMTGCYNHQV